jgi:nucleoside-diphosphate-sugar epimerase
MKQRILITGASGFIGSFIVEEALKQGFEVWAGTRKTSSKRYLQDKRIHFAELNLMDASLLKTQLEEHREAHQGWDYIIHCAGATKCKNKDDFEATNYTMTRSLIEILDDLDMRPKRFIYISTLSVYGPIHEKDNKIIREHDNPHPNTAYGISKLKTEMYLMQNKDYPYVTFRPTGVYGPRESDYFLMAKSIKNHLDFAVGYQPQDLTFVYVKDLVKCIFLAINKGVRRRAYIVSDGYEYNSKTFSQLIQKELEIKHVLHLKSPLFILKIISLLAELFTRLLNKTSTLNSDKYKIMKQRNWRCDITPAQEELGYVPDYNLEKGVQETINWYKKEGWL